MQCIVPPILLPLQVVQRGAVVPRRSSRRLFSGPAEHAEREQHAATNWDTYARGGWKRALLEPLCAGVLFIRPLLYRFL